MIWSRVEVVLLFCVILVHLVCAEISRVKWADPISKEKQCDPNKHFSDSATAAPYYVAFNSPNGNCGKCIRIAVPTASSVQKTIKSPQFQSIFKRAEENVKRKYGLIKSRVVNNERALFRRFLYRLIEKENEQYDNDSRYYDNDSYDDDDGKTSNVETNKKGIIAQIAYQCEDCRNDEMKLSLALTKKLLQNRTNEQISSIRWEFVDCPSNFMSSGAKNPSMKPPVKVVASSRKKLVKICLSTKKIRQNTQFYLVEVKLDNTPIPVKELRINNQLTTLLKSSKSKFYYFYPVSKNDSRYSIALKLPKQSKSFTNTLSLTQGKCVVFGTVLPKTDLSIGSIEVLPEPRRHSYSKLSVSPMDASDKTISEPEKSKSVTSSTTFIAVVSVAGVFSITILIAAMFLIKRQKEHNRPMTPPGSPPSDMQTL